MNPNIPTITAEKLLGKTIPMMYKHGLHQVRAKDYFDQSLIVHLMNAVLIGDLIVKYLSSYDNRLRGELNRCREEILFSLLFHDILKAENVEKGKRIDQQDVTPDDIERWLNKLSLKLKQTNPMRVAARAAWQDKIGYPVQVGLLGIRENDIIHIIFRLSDKLASITDINEHMYYERHGIPSASEYMDSLSTEVNKLIGSNFKFELLTHFHTKLQYPFLTNILLSATVKSLKHYRLKPIIIFYNGVVYLGEAEQCKRVQTEDALNKLPEQILENSWREVESTLQGTRLYPDNIQSKQQGMKVFAPLKLLYKPLTGRDSIFNALELYLERRTATKTFSKLKEREKKDKVKNFVAGALGILKDLRKHYALALGINDSNIPKIDLPKLNEKYLNASLAKVNCSDPASIAKFFSDVLNKLETQCKGVNWTTFQENVEKSFKDICKTILAGFLDKGICLGQHLLSSHLNNLKSTERFCPICGNQVIYKKEIGQKKSNQQRETILPAKVKSHTNSLTGAETDGTRIYCYTCFLELSLRSINYTYEVFDDKQTMLYLYLLPSFSFPMNWMKYLHNQFGLYRRDIRAQFGDPTIKLIFDSIFSIDRSEDGKWIQMIADPQRAVKEAFFTENERDEILVTPPVEVSNSVVITLHIRRTEGKPTEDEIPRKEIWSRGLMFSTVLAQILPIRVVLSESPSLKLNPYEIRRSLALINPPSVIVKLLSRWREEKIRTQQMEGIKPKLKDIQPYEIAIEDLPKILKLVTYAIWANKYIGSRRKSRRVVEVVNGLADELLVGAFYHQRETQGRKYKISKKDTERLREYETFTKACLEVDKMLSNEAVNRIRDLVEETQSFYSPSIYESSYAIGLPLKVAQKALQKLSGTGMKPDEIKSVICEDLEAAIKRQMQSDTRAWIILKRKKKLRKEGDPMLSQQLTKGVKDFVDHFFDGIINSMCGGDLDTFYRIRKRIYSGYLFQMKQLTPLRWKEEGWGKGGKVRGKYSTRPMED